MNEKIDFVVLWVDGSDSDWIEQFNRYAPEAQKKNGLDLRAERFQDYGLLRFWFRGVEQFAPWVNKVHFVTCGQKPDWLNLDAQKLHWVKHADYIRAEYLPVFSANPIEIGMRAIPDLAEHFVFFNDDMYLTASVQPEYYFKKGLPCDSASFTLISFGEGRCRIPHIYMNDLIEINRFFSKRDVLRGNFAKWNLCLRPHELIKNICLLPWNSITGISIRHHAQPYLKSTLETVWKHCPEALERTMRNRFRNRFEDVNQWLFRFWQLCEGNFIPVNHSREERMIKLSEWTHADTQAIIHHKYTEICIDDDTDEKDCPDYEQKMKAITEAFEKILPQKSSFEL